MLAHVDNYDLALYLFIHIFITACMLPIMWTYIQIKGDACLCLPGTAAVNLLGVLYVVLFCIEVGSSCVASIWVWYLVYISCEACNFLITLVCAGLALQSPSSSQRIDYFLVVPRVYLKCLGQITNTLNSVSKSVRNKFVGIDWH